MNIAYFDCIAGASGDMILGALLDSGLPLETLRQQLSALGLDDEFELQARKVDKNGFQATKVDVLLRRPSPAAGAQAAHGRHLAEIEALLERSALPTSVGERARTMFRRLAAVEAGIHGLPIEAVHLHEVGGVDTVVDITGALLGLQALGVEQITVSPLPLGRGFVRGAHGNIPLPAPATLALLQGIPVRGSDIEKELVTPTGAVILATLADGFGPIPPMTLQRVGYGAGGYDLPIPNVLRLLLGRSPGASIETLILLETNLDDDNPEITGYTMERLFAAGALDVYFAPIQMKKNRPATQVSVLCRPAQTEALEAVLYSETSTLGVRRQWLERRSLERSVGSVQTEFGAVRVKTARLPDGGEKSAPEYEDCRRVAEAQGVAIRRVYAAALASLLHERQ